MSKNNRFLPLILAVALGGAGPADIQAAVQAGAELQDRTLFRRVTDRLSVLYLMAGRAEDAVKLQKETMNMAGKPIPVDLVRSRGEELVTLLDEDFKEEEAAKLRAQFREAGIEIGSPSSSVTATPVKSAVPVAKPVVKASPPAAEPRPGVVRKSAPRAVAEPEPERPPVAVPEPGPIVRARPARTAVAPATPASKPVAKPAPARSTSPARIAKVIEEETVTVEEEAVPPAEPKRAVVKVRRVQTPIAPLPGAPAPAVATAPAKIAKKTYLTVPKSMIVPVKKTAVAQSQPLFPKKAKPVPVVVPEPDQPVKSV
ncbi:hypothetical protein KBA41_15020, partial [Candidatus Ozemobacteraceae bacterium]|nr:hypothetical protein [Candidatus Ozemobacteraceae bacterium]